VYLNGFFLFEEDDDECSYANKVKFERITIQTFNQYANILVLLHA